MSDFILTQPIALDDIQKPGQHIEIVNGEVIYRVARGLLHQLTGENIVDVIKPFVKANSLGVIFGEGLTCLMHSAPSSLRDSYLPHVSFTRAANILPDLDPTKPYPGVPDLAVEIVSPGNTTDSVMKKCQTYIKKGTEQVWVVYPWSKKLHQFRPMQQSTLTLYQKLGFEVVGTLKNEIKLGERYYDLCLMEKMLSE